MSQCACHDRDLDLLDAPSTAVGRVARGLRKKNECSAVAVIRRGGVLAFPLITIFHSDSCSTSPEGCCV